MEEIIYVKIPIAKVIDKELIMLNNDMLFLDNHLEVTGDFKTLGNLKIAFSKQNMNNIHKRMLNNSYDESI